MNELVILNALILLANMVVFGLTLKLYTEYFKDKSASNRGKGADTPERRFERPEDRPPPSSVYRPPPPPRPAGPENSTIRER